MVEINFTRDLKISKNILIIDGTSGAGKSLINEIVQGFENVELPIWDTLYEHISCLFFYGQMNESSAKVIIANAAEERIYNLTIGRNTNFRFTDNSSIFRNPNMIRNLTRIFKQEGEKAPENIRVNEPTLCLGTHHLLSFPDLFIKTFKNNLKILEMERHPASIVSFWQSRKWGERFGIDIRDFTLWIKYKKVNLPWFVIGNEELYLKLNNLEKIIYGFAWIQKSRQLNLEKNKDFLKKNLLSLQFEDFVIKPENYINKIEEFLGKKKKKNLKNIFKKLNLPRKNNSNIIEQQKLNIYNLDISKECKNIFKSLCNSYETRKI